jgi:hypothetical protein
MGTIYQAIDLKGVVDLFGIRNVIETGTGEGHSLQYMIDTLPSDVTIHSV